jgi:hypothetical protein
MPEMEAMKPEQEMASKIREIMHTEMDTRMQDQLVGPQYTTHLRDLIVETFDRSMTKAMLTIKE